MKSKIYVVVALAVSEYACICRRARFGPASTTYHTARGCSAGASA